jgi:hypothetical protein
MINAITNFAEHAIRKVTLPPVVTTLLIEDSLVVVVAIDAESTCTARYTRIRL